MPGARPSAAGSATPDEQHGTRNRVARSILDHGPSTAAELALRLELTQAAVRRHLDTLVSEGVVEARAKRVYGSRGRGRPAKVFALTDCGRDAFDQAYDQLAADAMRWIARTAGGGAAGDAAVAEFARARVEAQAERYWQALDQVPPEERTKALAEALTEDGYAATARSAPASAEGAAERGSGGEQLCQHHCPVAHTAEQFPQLCEAETEVFSRLLGTHVQRLATIAHGDGVCTTFVPQTRTDGQAGGGSTAGGTKTAGRKAGGTARSTSSTRSTSTAGGSAGTSTTSNATTAKSAGRNPA
ncbi:ArsR family transcriptional regulator [Streptomyces armeniacus]|uniref:ArsR family transcriptional regulator n=1 Tax=Streptomyces armeniacus TaxID=83291 RepID=A0A345Y027_9ACTN|nr:ArsR family transcriptional regulator [Streptomyces armeniacus]AXK37243.1 ArsR family transcriptional regulator [Streptomyces armeniacus]